jgi:hypothetical protein
MDQKFCFEAQKRMKITIKGAPVDFNINLT